MRLERYERWVWGLCAFAYVYVFPYQSTLNNPNENVRFYMTAALVESQSYAIDAQRERWGWVNDAAVRGGHVYSVKAPGTSFLGVPGYAAYLGATKLLGREYDRTEALWVCRLTGTIAPTLLGAWFFMAFLRRRGLALSLRLCGAVAVWLGSLLYGYGMLFVSHTLSAVVAFAGFAFLYEVERGARTATPLSAAWFGLLAAATTWFEYPGLVASFVLLIYALYVLRSCGLRAAWLIGSLPPALIMMHFQYRAFGSPFTPGHLFVESDAFRAAHEQGLYGAVGVSPAALYGLLLDPGAGLFPLTPLLCFGLPGLWLQLRERAQRAGGITCSALFVLSCLAIAAMNNWRGGWTVGPRYLAVCVPFLAFPALVALDRLARRAPLMAAGLGLGTAAASLVGSGIPSAYYPHLPPELTRPLPQLFSVLIAHDFAPPNLGNWFGVWGTASLLPLFAAGLAALALCCIAALRGAPAGQQGPAGSVRQSARGGLFQSRDLAAHGGDAERTGAERAATDHREAVVQSTRRAAVVDLPAAANGGDAERTSARPSAAERREAGSYSPDPADAVSLGLTAAGGEVGTDLSRGARRVGSRARPADAVATVGVSLVVLGVCLVPLFWRPRAEPGVAKAVGFVTSRFQPAGHDRAARLRAQLMAAGASAESEVWKTLEQTYREEGREREAGLAAKRRLPKP